jgi:hypothetical protein
MKYWWTLGCFPSGRETPFRLNEFLATYQAAHVPVEVEEWLDCFIKHPAEQLVPTLEALLEHLEGMEGLEETEGYQLPEPSVVPLLPALKRLEDMATINISPVAVRAVMADKALRKRACDDTYEYLEAVRHGGSTPHRRAGYAQLSMDLTDDAELPVAQLSDTNRVASSRTSSSAQRGADLMSAASNRAGAVLPRPDDATSRIVSDSFSGIADDTSYDEKCLISLVTTFAEGAVKKKKFGDAANMLANLLLFSHDDDVRAAVHANVATAQNLNGLYKEAEFHGREAALLRSSPRGYANWATAVAYQDDFERATSIISDALVECPNDDTVRRAHEQITALQASLPNRRSVPLELRGKRAYSPAQQQRGLEQGEGRNFQNMTDVSVFRHKQLNSKLNPKEFELGSVFRRVGDLGGHISSTKSMEGI